MPKYKLTYFNAKGRAETSRILFALAKQEYEDDRFAFEDWPQRKPGMFYIYVVLLYKVHLFISKWFIFKFIMGSSGPSIIVSTYPTIGKNHDFALNESYVTLLTINQYNLPMK